MRSFDDARRALLADVKRVGIERIALRHAAGRVLAEGLVAREPLPRFDNSAMDGYAVAARDLEGTGPWTLPVVGESAAGAVPAPLVRESSCRVFTGAMVPAGADAVIMQEDVARSGGMITFTSRPRVGAHIRRAGEDMRAGERAVEAGTRLGPGHLALAGMLDRGELAVARPPVVVIVCTGNELRAAGDGGDASLLAASIAESNSAPIAALAAQATAVVRVAPIARDDPEATVRALTDALRTTDLLLTIGGVSVGDHDVVRPALERAGVTLDFWKVAMKPGKPLAVGRSAASHVLGLPGNPASAMVTFALFGMPLLRTMQGDVRPLPMPLMARLTAPRERSTERLELVRVSLAIVDGELVAHAHANQSSGAATSLAGSDGIAAIPAGAGELGAGARVEVFRWADF